VAEYVAVDLGAESGRVIVGEVGRIEVVHRFPNGPVRIGDVLYWDIFRIYSEIKQGLRAAFAARPGRIRSIGLDSWGVDYGLLDGQGDLLGNLYHYRDRRTDGIPEQVFALMPWEQIYRETGIQYMQLNTIYQLYAHLKQKPQALRQARHLLTLPNLLNYWLTGVMSNEYTHVTTTQLYNPAARDWSWKLIDALGFDRRLFGQIVQPGTRLGRLLPHVAHEVGAEAEVEVVAPATHDTGSAVAAVPAAEEDGAEYAYISSGTWSLQGIESPRPIIDDRSCAYNFTNEGAADGGIRFLKNITGLWIVQECKRYWDRADREHSYAELTEMAEQSGPAVFRIDPNDERFLRPGVLGESMPDRIEAYCRETGQEVPQGPGQLVRGVLESLAALYASTMKELQELSGRRLRRLYIIGGGCQNRLLCQLAADATGLTVHAGPVEATAIGNILVQAMAMGELPSIQAGRKRIRDSYPIERYEPSR
jgi:rhamnulokinase